MRPTPFRIFHPTDLSAAGRHAFELGLGLALMRPSVLTILHVAGDRDVDPGDLPAVRDTLAQWGLMDPGEGQGALMRLGLGVNKMIVQGGDPLKSCIRHLERRPADLVVLAHGSHVGPMTWLDRRISEPLARKTTACTLFMPTNARSFIRAADGATMLRRILLPIARDPDPSPAIQWLVNELTSWASGDGPLVVELLHVGDASTAPRISLPAHNGVRYTVTVLEGDPVRTIPDHAEASHADMIMMPTKGHNGFLDLLRGDTTERVLRSAGCPVLAIPA